MKTTNVALKALKVTMFKGSDGVLHETAAAWRLSEARLAINGKIKDLLHKSFVRPEGESQDFSADDVCKFVKDNSAALVDMLVALQPKKPRATRTGTALGAE